MALLIWWQAARPLTQYQRLIKDLRLLTALLLRLDCGWFELRVCKLHNNLGGCLPASTAVPGCLLKCGAIYLTISSRKYRQLGVVLRGDSDWSVAL